MAPGASELETLLEQGQLTKALRKAKAAGLPLSQERIAAAATKMLRSGRAGELLSLVGSPGITLPFDAPTMLRRAFEGRDYHGFLKQAHRLGMIQGLERDIGQAIAAIEAHAPREAAAWRRKFPLAQVH